MAKRMRDMSTFLIVAQDLYDSGKIDDSDYLRLVHSIEVSYKDPNSFVAQITKWCIDFIQVDDVENHLANFNILVDSFLNSPDADDYKTRTEVLEVIAHFKKLLTGIKEYEQKILINKYLNQ